MKDAAVINSSDGLNALIDETNQIVKILSSIILTSKQNQRDQKF
ncbi:MAG: hypothetical protein COV74_05195 [Candidatus Omnitrophica bacterium CG11_big_fil_rev_8_21_14_0_20_45_26]|uniref:Uncharacterized protein n=1 Tax=Candidatus Abzuiibacterium crystallinum TaxID=1974748 RepID=A0A2H0LPJ0_9BACT|nr:MAG: hypothetical protein COV74_05195 [Candidatus Omnitrophica bacterium CG11_big_fil_rev_8_21_14_0_20_45_26]PIW63548.1 MAG: hypothetical protein COW12_10105 [Candidatus Omnitrophica bacterium CG12_big_fil_rev_8_21_14_0_65_45_16]